LTSYTCTHDKQWYNLFKKHGVFCSAGDANICSSEGFYFWLLDNPTFSYAKLGKIFILYSSKYDSTDMDGKLIGDGVTNFIKKEKISFSDRKMYYNIDHILLDKRQHSSIVDVWSIRGADCDTDHYLVVSEVRDRWSVSK